MSLGFNSQRRRRHTNLPGAVGAAVITMEQRPNLPRRVRKVSETLVESVSSPVPLSSSVKLPVPLLLSAEDPSSPTSSVEHFVYATVVGKLACEERGDSPLCKDGERVCMVYPMEKTDDEKVVMRMKTVDSVTGQLKYDWVVVHDLVTHTSFLKNFSLIP